MRRSKSKKDDHGSLGGGSASPSAEMPAAAEWDCPAADRGLQDYYRCSRPAGNSPPRTPTRTPIVVNELFASQVRTAPRPALFPQNREFRITHLKIAPAKTCIPACILALTTGGHGENLTAKCRTAGYAREPECDRAIRYAGYCPASTWMKLSARSGRA